MVEQIAFARDGQNEAGRFGIVSEDAPQRVDVLAEVGIVNLPVRPDVLLNLLLAHEVACVRQQQLQDFERFPLERHQLPIQAQLVPSSLQDKSSELVSNPLLVFHLCYAITALPSTNTRAQGTAKIVGGNKMIVRTEGVLGWK